MYPAKIVAEMRVASEGRPGAAVSRVDWPTQGRVVVVDERNSGEFRGTTDLTTQRIVLNLSGGSSNKDGQGLVGSDRGLTPAGSFAEADLDLAGFMPAAALAFKAKSFNDGVQAAVELAIDGGAGNLPGKARFIDDLLRALLDESDDGNAASAAVFVEAARITAGDERDSLTLPPELAREAGTAARRFLADPALGQPTGYFSWDSDLGDLSRRDRFLQQPLGEEAWRGMADAIAASGGMLARYSALLDLVQQLFGPYRDEDLRWRIRGARRPAAQPAGNRVALFPAIEAPVVKVGNGRVRADRGGISDTAGRAVGEAAQAGAPFLQEAREEVPWILHQLDAFSSLTATEHAPESSRLRLGRDCLAERERLLGSLLGADHALSPAAARPTPEQSVAQGHDDGLIAEMAPQFTVEPAPEFYRRQALAYRGLRDRLADSLGEEALATMVRLAPDGELMMPLLHELMLMERLFHGAYLTTCTELGLPPEFGDGVGTERGPVADMQFFKLWQSGALDDPDLSRDVRMMMPVGYNAESGKHRVRAVLGIGVRHIEARFEETPRLSSVSGGLDPSAVTVRPHSATYPTAFLVTLESEAARPIEGEAFRQLCIENATYERIAAAINRLR